MRGSPTPGKRWADTLAEAAKAFWYLLLRTWRFIEPVFTGIGSRPGVERGKVHIGHRSRTDPAEERGSASGDPILRALRQRAALELFEWLGLDQIPSGYWTLLERMGDPSRALIRFISSSRFDATRVRRRDAAELAAFQNFVRFVCQVEETGDLVSARQRDLLDRHIHFGDHALVRSLVEQFVALNEAVNVFDRSAASCRFAAFVAHTRKVAALREKAVATDLGEAKALLATARRYGRLTWRFRSAVEEKARIEAVVREEGGPMSQLEHAAWAGAMSELAQIQRALMEEAECDVEVQVEDFEQGVHRLFVLSNELARRRREGQARREQERRRQRERESSERIRSGLAGREAHDLSRDELLSIFGFASGASPELATLRRAFVREANKSQPLSGQTDYRERNDRYRVLKDAYERLKVALG